VHKLSRGARKAGVALSAAQFYEPGARDFAGPLPPRSGASAVLAIVQPISRSRHHQSAIRSPRPVTVRSSLSSRRTPRPRGRSSRSCGSR
jgi:hypothetical protein